MTLATSGSGSGLPNWWSVTSNGVTFADFAVGTNTGFERVDTETIVLTRTAANLDYLHLFHEAPTPRNGIQVFCPGVKTGQQHWSTTAECPTAADSDLVYTAVDIRVFKGKCNFYNMTCAGRGGLLVSWKGGHLNAGTDTSIDDDACGWESSTNTATFKWVPTTARGLSRGSKQSSDYTVSVARNPADYWGPFDTDQSFTIELEYRLQSSWVYAPSLGTGIKDFQLWTQRRTSGGDYYADPIIIPREVVGTRVTIASLPCSNMCDEHTTIGACLAGMNNTECWWCKNVARCLPYDQPCPGPVASTITAYNDEVTRCGAANNLGCESCSALGGCGWCVGEGGVTSCQPTGPAYGYGPWQWDMPYNAPSTFGTCVNGFYYSGSLWADCSAVHTYNWARDAPYTVSMDMTKYDQWCSATAEGGDQGSAHTCPVTSDGVNVISVWNPKHDTGSAFRGGDGITYSPRTYPDRWGGDGGTEAQTTFVQSANGRVHNSINNGLSWLMVTDIAFPSWSYSGVILPSLPDRFIGLHMGGVRDITGQDASTQSRAEFIWHHSSHLVCDAPSGAPLYTRRGIQLGRDHKNTDGTPLVSLYRNLQIGWRQAPNIPSIQIAFGVIDRAQWGLDDGLQYVLYMNNTLMFTANDDVPPFFRNAYGPTYEKPNVVWGPIVSGDQYIFYNNLKHRALLPELQWGHGSDGTSTTSLDRTARCNRPFSLARGPNLNRMYLPSDSVKASTIFVFHFSFPHENTTIPANCSWTPTSGGSYPTYRTTFPAGYPIGNGTRGFPAYGIAWHTNQTAELASSLTVGYAIQPLRAAWKPVISVYVPGWRLLGLSQVFVKAYTTLDSTPVHIYPAQVTNTSSVTVGTSSTSLVAGVAFGTIRWGQAQFTSVNVAASIRDTGVRQAMIDGSLSFTLYILASVIGSPQYAGPKPTVVPSTVTETSSDCISTGLLIFSCSSRPSSDKQQINWAIYPTITNGIYHPLYANSLDGIIVDFNVTLGDTPTIYTIDPNPLSTSGGLFNLYGINMGVTPYTTVFFNGIPLSSCSGSPTALACNYGPGVGANNRIVVRNGDPSVGIYVNSSVFLVDYQKPAISSVAPGSDVNPAWTNGSQIITITGTGFGTDASFVLVTIGGRACPVTGTVEQTKILCVSPIGYGTSQQMVVSVAWQTVLFSSFQYGAPVIDSITPNVGDSYSTRITLTGRNFYVGNDGDGVISIRVASSYSCLTSSAITHLVAYCDLPHLLGGVIISMTVGSQSSNTLSFIFNGPTITSVSPTSGKAGLTTTISGRNFFGASFPSSVSVRLGDSIILSATRVNDATITAVIPNGAGRLRISVTIAVGSTSYTVVAADQYAFQYDGPKVILLAPANGPTSGTKNLVVSGENLVGPGVAFTPTPVVSVDGVDCTVTAGSSYTLTIDLPKGVGAAVLGQAAVLVKVSGSAGDMAGTRTSQDTPVSFQYDAPTITSITPTTFHNYAASRDLVITGTNFYDDSSKVVVFIGTVPCAYKSVSADLTSLTCTLSFTPYGQGANLSVIVLVNGRLAPSNYPAVQWSYPPPSIVSQSPTTLLMSGGTILSLTGNDFGDSPKVYLNGRLLVLASAVSCSQSLNTGGSSCAIRAITWPGEALDNQVILSVGGQNVTSSFTVKYSDPILNSIDVTGGPAAGGTAITFTGTNLGAVLATSMYTIMITGTNCLNGFCGNVSSLPSSAAYVQTTSSSITIQMPPAIGVVSFQFFIVNTSPTRVSNVLSQVYTYAPPNIYELVGCVADSPNIRQCPIVGTQIYVRGQGFGPWVSQISAFVLLPTVGATPCSNVILYNDSCISCILPASPAGGSSLPFRVKVGTNVATLSVGVSYYSPMLAFNPIDVHCSGAFTQHYTLPSVNGGDRICIWGSQMGTLASKGSVTYTGTNIDMKLLPAPSSLTYTFSCVVVSWSETMIECYTSPGAGANLTWTVTYDGVPSPPHVATISYPVPVIIPATIRSTIGGSLGVVLLENPGAPGQGSNVIFNVMHVPSNYQLFNDLLRIGIAQPGNTSAVCGSIKVWSPQGSGDAANRTYQLGNSMDIKAVGCTTDGSYTNPKDYHFTIAVFGQLSNTGTDTYNYPPGAPTVAQVTSYTCEQSDVNLVNCDTKGGAVLTITGTNFCDPDLDSCVMQIKIGSVDCGLPYTYFSDTTISCVLPSSTGISLPVSVQVSSATSSTTTAPTISYSPAYITAVSGCTPTITGLATIDCDNTLSSSFSTSSYSSSDSSYSLSMFNNDNNNGNNNGQMVLSSVTSMPMLTIRGYNFGPSSAIILVAGQICSNVTHDSLSPHNIITCVLPPGRLTQQSISIIPSGGLMSTSDASSVYVSYRQCGLGTWRSLSSNTSYTCNDCAIGTYSNKRGSEACTSCPMGRTANITGSTACVTCTAGRYANGNVTCRRCDLGTYSTSNGKMGCSLCPAGTIADARGATACVACAIGSYQISIGASSCISCGQSEYQPSKGSLSCIACPYGKTNASISAASCVDCPAGRARGMNDGASCVACPLGTYSLAGSQSCIQCGSGTYADTIESPSCKPCAAGNYSVGNPDSGPRICTPCAAGTYTATTGQKQCLRCPQGTYNPLTGASSCLPCDAGTVGNGDQAISCSSPPYGTFVSSSGSVISDACLPGTYSIGDTSGTIACTECPAGRSQKNSGQSYCEDCTPGRATALTGQRECPACSSGRYTSLSGQETCDDCELGEYASPGQPCSLASAGRYALLQQSQPYDCPAGRWTDQQGTYQNDSLPCYACPPGYKSRDQLPLLRDGCDQCPIGRYAKDEGSAVCLSCPPGFICPTIQMTSPVACQPGTYNPASGAITCLACGAGMGNPLEGQSSCTPCSAGSFANTTTGLCDSCIAGRYTPSANSSVCLLCPSGKSTDTAGQTSCLSCDSGRYNQLTGQTSCAPCQAGKYGNGSIALCGLCNVGSYSSVEGQGTCLQCPLGRYGNGTGLTDCLPCSLGAYSSASGKSACDLCQVGSYSPITSAISCTLCPAGQYQPANGSFICIPCPIGTYNGQVGASSCAICTPGTYNPSTGQAKCLLCGQGTYNTVYNATSCDSCQAGTIQSIEGTTTCSICDIGTYASGLKNSECRPCAAGSYNIVNASSECTPCPKGRFQNVTGASDCYMCEPGEYQDLTSQTICFTCSSIEGSSSGYFNDGYEQSSCKECPALMTATVGGLSCDCGKGAFSFDPAIIDTDCHVCPQGAQCNTVGLLAVNMAATSGWWRPSLNSTAYYECLVPSHCLGGSASTCASYRTGPICAICQSGSIPTSGGSCEPCNASAALNWFQTIVIIIVIIVIMITMYYALLRADRRLLAATIADEALRIKRLREGLTTPLERRKRDSQMLKEDTNNSTLLLSFHLHEPQSRRNSTSSIGNESTNSDDSNNGGTSSGASTPTGTKVRSILDRDVDHHHHSTKHSSVGDGPDIGHKPNFTYKLKILLGYFQIGTSLVTLLDVQWPTAFKSFFIVFNVFNLDFLQWSSIACVARIGYFTKYIFAVITPPIVLALIFGFYVLPYYVYHWKRKTLDSSAMRRRTREAWKLLLFTLFIIYPKVSSTIMNMYACRTVEGYSYIISDFTTNCDDDQWRRYLPANIITILLYPIGIPVFFFVLLMRARHDFDDYGVRLQLGFLYDGYRRGTWYFELIDMTHKFILTALLQFLPTFVQIRFGMAIVVAYLMVILVQQPYYRKGDDRFHLFAQIQILLILIAAGLFHSGTPDDVSNAAMSVFLIMLCIAFLLFFIGQSANIIRKRFGHLWKEFKYRLRTGGKSLADHDTAAGNDDGNDTAAATVTNGHMMTPDIILSDDNDDDATAPVTELAVVTTSATTVPAASSASSSPSMVPLTTLPLSSPSSSDDQPGASTTVTSDLAT